MLGRIKCKQVYHYRYAISISFIKRISSFRNFIKIFKFKNFHIYFKILREMSKQNLKSSPTAGRSEPVFQKCE